MVIKDFLRNYIQFFFASLRTTLLRYVGKNSAIFFCPPPPWPNPGSASGFHDVCREEWYSFTKPWPRGLLVNPLLYHGLRLLCHALWLVGKINWPPSHDAMASWNCLLNCDGNPAALSRWLRKLELKAMHANDTPSPTMRSNVTSVKSRKHLYIENVLPFFDEFHIFTNLLLLCSVYKMIKAILVFNNHGKPRLSKFYQYYVSRSKLTQRNGQCLVQYSHKMFQGYFRRIDVHLVTINIEIRSQIINIDHD